MADLRRRGIRSLCNDLGAGPAASEAASLALLAGFAFALFETPGDYDHPELLA